MKMFFKSFPGFCIQGSAWKQTMRDGTVTPSPYMYHFKPSKSSVLYSPASNSLECIVTRSLEGVWGLDSPPEQTGRNSQISIENTCSCLITEVQQCSLVSTGWEPHVLLCMAQAGARSTHLVDSAAFMGLEYINPPRRVGVLAFCE